MKSTDCFETKIGPIVKEGRWTVALEIEEVETHRDARVAAYYIAAEIGRCFEHDVRVVEPGPGMPRRRTRFAVVLVEVGEDAHFEPVIGALRGLAEKAISR